MYINKLIYENVGPLNWVDIGFSFNEDGSPKPILLVGENGCGKSTILSNIVDSFYEMADRAFGNATETDGRFGHQFYKTINSIEINSGSNYMFSYLQYFDNKYIEYVLKCGNVPIDHIKEKIGTNGTELFNSTNGDSFKKVTVEKNDVERIWGNNVICYFGPDRYEKPAWMGNKYFENKTYYHPRINERWNGQLSNPISVHDVTSINLQWLLDVIVDSRGDIRRNGDSLTLEHIEPHILLEMGRVRKNIEQIMGKILGDDIYFGLNLRNHGQDRFKIIRSSDGHVISPSLDSLSTGQIALFNLFSTIVRYADNNRIENTIELSKIQGIVVIDEIELHLHATLQREVIPKLIKLFPKVQFIITTHSPLFLLGMQETFGDEAFDVYELPSAQKITVERFSQFQKAYEYFKKTETYQREAEDTLNRIRAQTSTKPLVITEGPTDWKHMKAAFKSLKNKGDYSELFEGLDFEFFEYESINSSTDSEYKLEMGNTMLVGICTNLAKLPLERKYIFIADRDNKITNNNIGEEGKSFKTWSENVYSFLLPIPEIRENTPEICIEHLYSDDEIKSEVDIDSTHRRLFIGNEFDVRGVSSDGLWHCGMKNCCGEKKINIIDDKVTCISDHSQEPVNYALPKMKFAEYVTENPDRFDFSNFVEIFQIIKDIIKEQNS